MAKKYYVVWAGRETGIFTSWDYTKKLVDKFPQAKYKSFPSEAEAKAAVATAPMMPAGVPLARAFAELCPTNHGASTPYR